MGSAGGGRQLTPSSSARAHLGSGCWRLSSPCKNSLRFWDHSHPVIQGSCVQREFPSLRANRPFKPLQRGHICPTVVFFSSSYMDQEIHHLPTHCQTPCLGRDAPNTLQTLLADQTSASKPVQTRAESRKEPDLPQIPHHTQTGLQVPTRSQGFSS